MNVLILNGSARGGKGVTGRLLESLSRGLTKANAKVKTFDIVKLSISPCTACLMCMHKTPGECSIKDDMELIYEAYKTSDLLILATPVYLDTMTAQMKAVLIAPWCSCSLSLSGMRPAGSVILLTGPCRRSLCCYRLPVFRKRKF